MKELVFLTSVASFLRAQGASLKEIYASLYVLNRRLEEPFEDFEVKKIAASIGGGNGESGRVEKEFEFMTGTQIMQAKINELGWSIKNLLPSSGFSIISGMPNSYKTWLALSIALVCQSPGSHNSAFIKLDEAPKKVLYVDNEGGENIKKRIQQLAAGLKVQMTDNFHLFQNLELHKASQRNDFMLKVMEDDFQLVFFDTMSSIFQLREDKMDGWQSVLEWFSTLNRMGIQPVALHHFRKPGQYDKEPESHWLSGWFGLVRTVDWVIATIKMNATCVKVKNLKARDLAQPGLLYLDMIFSENSAALVPGFAPPDDTKTRLPYRPTASPF